MTKVDVPTPLSVSIPNGLWSGIVIQRATYDEVTNSVALELDDGIKISIPMSENILVTDVKESDSSAEDGNIPNKFFSSCIGCKNIVREKKTNYEYCHLKHRFYKNCTDKKTFYNL